MPSASIGLPTRIAMRTFVEMAQYKHTDRFAEGLASRCGRELWPCGVQYLSAREIEPVWFHHLEALVRTFDPTVAKITSVKPVDGWTIPTQTVDARLCRGERADIPAILDPRTNGLPIVSSGTCATANTTTRRRNLHLQSSFLCLESISPPSLNSPAFPRGAPYPRNGLGD